jgi:hypothetical protein
MVRTDITANRALNGSRAGSLRFFPGIRHPSICFGIAMGLTAPPSFQQTIWTRSGSWPYDSQPIRYASRSISARGLWPVQAGKIHLNGAIRRKQEAREAVGSGGLIREANVPIVAATLSSLSRKIRSNRTARLHIADGAGPSRHRSLQERSRARPLGGVRFIRPQDEYRDLTDLSFLRCKISRSP